MFAYSQKVQLKNLILKTEAALKEHHDQGMSGWVAGTEVGGSVFKVKSGHEH